MEGAGLIIGLFPVVILFFFGWLIKYKKAYWLISGYNTMPAVKKKNVDTQGLGKFIGNACFVMAALISSVVIFFELKLTSLAFIATVLLFLEIIYILINAQKYDGNTRDGEGNMNKGTKVILGFIITVLLIVAVGVGTLFYYSSKPAEYKVDGGVLAISGMYGQKIPLDEVSDIELKNVLPKILRKTNGSALGDIYKGNFRLDGIDEAKLYLDISKPPFVYIRWGTKIVILNARDSKETEQLFEELLAEWN